MNTCWKCGRETVNTDSECDDCREGLLKPDPATARAMKQWLEELPRTHVVLDWSKVQTFEELRLVMQTLWPCLYMERNSREAQTLRGFTRPVADRTDGTDETDGGTR